MSSELFVFDESFFSEPFSPFADQDIVQGVQENYSFDCDITSQQNPVDEANSFSQIANNWTTMNTILSCSPPSNRLENLCLDLDSARIGYVDSSALEVKTEQCHVPFDEAIFGYGNSFVPQNYVSGAAENAAAKMMQRGYSSNSFDGKPNFSFKPPLDGLLESPNFQTQVLSSPENSSSTSQMRRVCSTGDLQKMKTIQTSQRLSSSPLGTESSYIEDANFRVGKYSAEERKERIDRYRAKRNQRNFNKTIKYACRKTLADNRPRIRGRFARNDEAGETPKAALSRYEDDDDLWIDGLQEDGDEGATGAKGGGVSVPIEFYNGYGTNANQFQCYSYSRLADWKL